MVLRLRLARVSTPGGAHRHLPRYNIVLAQARTARDSKPLEVLGTYDPIPTLPIGSPEGARKQKDIKVDVSRAKYWLGVGAQPSDTVWRLLSMIGLLEPRYLPTGPQTDKALKAVRFPTQQPSHSNNNNNNNNKDQSPGRVTRAVRISATGSSTSASPPAGTTSPQDPNAA